MSCPGTIPSWIGTEVRDRDGHPVGVVCALELDARTRRPAAFVVALPDRRRARVAAAGARCAVDHVRVAGPVAVAASAPAA
jgi:hypothetical protein